MAFYNNYNRPLCIPPYSFQSFYPGYSFNPNLARLNRSPWQQYEVPPRFSSQTLQNYNSNFSDNLQSNDGNRLNNDQRQPHLQTFRRKPFVNFIRYEKTKPYAVDPTFTQEEAPGINLFNPETGTVTKVAPGEQVKINTHIVFKFPPNKFGFIVDKASMVTGKQLKVILNVVYTDYHGEIFVTLMNMSKKEVDIFPGESIAQMILLVSCIPLLRKEANVDSKPTACDVKEMQGYQKCETGKNLDKGEYVQNGSSSLYRIA